MDHFRDCDRRVPATPEWEREVAEAGERFELPGDKPRFNRQRLFEALPELERFYLDGHMEPPDELPDLDEEALAALVEQLPETGFPEMVAVVGRHHLAGFEWVRLRHPRSGFEVQLNEEQGTLQISMLDDQEDRDADGRLWRRRVRFVETAESGFCHEDLLALIEEQPEHPEPPASATEPATRLELVSVLSLLVESDVIHREKP